MARISTPSMSLSLSLNMSARGGLSPQAQAVKEILLSLVSRPSLETVNCSWSVRVYSLKE
jgi:LysR family nitrogen assimilation transcriptional regulator